MRQVNTRRGCPGGGRRPRGRLRRHRRGAPRSPRRAGAGPLPPRRQLLERSQDARGRAPTATTGAPAGARAASSKNCGWPTPSTIRSAAGSCGTCCSTTKWSASRISRCCSKPSLYSADDEGRPHRPRSLARCDKSEHLYRIQRQDVLRLHGRFAARARSRRGDAHRAAKRAPNSANRWRPRSRTTARSGRSILFTSRLYHNPMPFTPPSWARKITKEHWSTARSRAGNTATGGSSGAAIRISSRDNERIRFELLSHCDGRLGLHQEQRRFPGQQLTGRWTGWA